MIVNRAGNALNPEDLRSLFPVTREHVILDNAAEGPCALSVAAELVHYIETCSAIPGAMRDVGLLAEAACERLENLFQVPRRNLSFVPSTTMGFLFLAASLPLEPGAVVLVPENEYPATVLPWLSGPARHRVRVDLLPVDPYPAGGVPQEVLRAALDRPGVRVLMLSAVNWLGYRYSLPAIAELCRSRGVILAVDGSQAVGMCDLRPRELGIPFLSTTFFKWAFAPEGIGCVYVADELRSRLDPVLMGVESLEIDPDHLLAYNAGFPAATAPLVLSQPAPLCLVGLTAAIDLLLEIGLQRIEEHAFRLAAMAVRGLEKAGFQIRSDPHSDHLSGILVFSHPDSTLNSWLARELRTRGVFVGYREGLLRISVHAYNTDEDLEQLFEALANLKSLGRDRSLCAAPHRP